MQQLLSLSRSARLAGVSRGELQKRIHQEGVETFEGQIRLEDLAKLYSDIGMDKDPVFERLQRIKREALSKTKPKDSQLPDPEIMMSRLQQYQHTLVQTKAALNHSEQLLGDTTTGLQAALDLPPEELRGEVHKCIEKLQKAMSRLDRMEDARAAMFAKNAMLKIVSAGVRLLPSNHEFFVEGNDSILEAGLRAGLYLDYGCSSGNCGACKCKVVSGTVRKLREHDYVLSAWEKEQGHILACSYTAVTSLVLEASEAGNEDALPRQEIRTQVKKLLPNGDDLVLMTLQTPRTQSLRFKAGQRVTLTAENDAEISLYVASCPCDGRNLQFLVPRGDNGAFGKIVFDGSIANQTVMLKGPEGTFLLEDDSSRPAVFFAAGNGLAPIKSLLEQTIAIDNAEYLRLILEGDSKARTPINNLLRSWNDSLDSFKFVAVEGDAAADDLLQLAADSGADLAGSNLYAAGPGPWLQALHEAAENRGFDAARWRIQQVD